MTTLRYAKAKHVVTLGLPKSPGTVFDHLLDLSKWWPEDFVGEPVQPGSGFVLKTGDGHFSKNKVLELVPGKKLVWLTTESRREGDGYDWTGTTFIFELSPKGNNTELTFTYDGLVLEEEAERLVQVCDMCVKEMFYNFVVNGKGKQDLMENKNYTTTIEVTNSPEQIFQRVTNDIAKWWGGKDFSGTSTELNDEFIINHPGAHYSKQRLIEVIPDKKVVWLVTESKLSWLKNEEEWTNTKLIFEISAKPHSHLLHFTHEGLVPEKESFVRCSEGWNMVIKDWLYTLIMYDKAHF
jgi:hypothetical protein